MRCRDLLRLGDIARERALRHRQCRAPPDTPCPDTRAAFRAGAGEARRCERRARRGSPASCRKRSRARARAARVRASAAPECPCSRNAAMNSGGIGKSSPSTAITAGLPCASIVGSQRVDLVHRVAWASRRPSACTGCRCRDRRAAPRRCSVQIVRSRSTCAVTSTGLSSDAKAASAAFSAVERRGAEPRNVEADRVAEIEREALTAPELVMMPGPFDRRLEARQQLRGVDQLLQRLDHD